MYEREAFRAIFSFGGTIDSLNAGQVSGLDSAMKNARAFAAEVVTMLRQAQPAEAA
jgi:chromosome partitioning protein